MPRQTMIEGCRDAIFCVSGYTERFASSDLHAGDAKYYNLRENAIIAIGFFLPALKM